MQFEVCEAADMDLLEKHPYRGKERNGTCATVSPGVSRQFFHSCRYLPDLARPVKTAIWSFAVGGAALVFGYLLCQDGSPATMAGGVIWLLIGAGGMLFGLWGVISAARTWKWRNDTFQNALLTAGVVVSEEPVAVAVLAEMSWGGRSFPGIIRLNVPDLPVHGEYIGTRVPCVSTFMPKKGVSHRWGWFFPIPICHGTSRVEDLNQCFDRLGEESFRQIESCIRRGLVPPDEEQILLLDKDLQALEWLDWPGWTDWRPGQE